MGIYEFFNFANFVILNASAKIKASTHFGSIYLKCISCCRYYIQKSQIYLLSAKPYNLNIFLFAIDSCYAVGVILPLRTCTENQSYNYLMVVMRCNVTNNTHQWKYLACGKLKHPQKLHPA